MKQMYEGSLAIYGDPECGEAPPTGRYYSAAGQTLCITVP